MDQDQRVVTEGLGAEQPPATLDGDTTVQPTLLRGRSTKRARKATRRRIEANRRNALRSTGPRTLEGKQIVARNALKHGLTSTSVLLPGDDPAEYERFAAGMRLYCPPIGELEKRFTQIIIDTMWVRLHLSKIEAGALGFLLSDDVGPGVLAEDSNRVLEILSRYTTTKERTLTWATRNLERLQDVRKEESHPERATGALRGLTAHAESVGRRSAESRRQSYCRGDEDP